MYNNTKYTRAYRQIALMHGRRSANRYSNKCTNLCKHKKCKQKNTIQSNKKINKYAKIKQFNNNICVCLSVRLYVCVYVFVYVCSHAMTGTWLPHRRGLYKILSRQMCITSLIYICIHTHIPIYTYIYICICM